MNLKIALFTSQFPGKVSTFFARDVINLLEHSLDVDIYTIYPVNADYWKYVPDAYRDRIRDSVSIKYIFPLLTVLPNKEILRDLFKIIKDSLGCGFGQLSKSILVILQGLRFSAVANGQYDHMVAYWGNYAATFAYIANRSSKNKPPLTIFLHAGTDLYRDQIFLLEKLKFATNIVTVCEFNKSYLRDLYPGEFELIKEKMIIYHLGVEIQESHDQAERENLLCVGSLHYVKGFHLVIEALNRLSGEFPKLRLTIVGEGPQRKQLEKLAELNGVRSRIDFLGQLPYSEVAGYFKTSAILVHPSIGLGDAVPTVIKEALSFGLPVVGSNAVGIPELLDNGRIGTIFEQNDLNGLCMAIRDLLTNPEKRITYSKQSKEFAMMKFDAQKNGRQLLIDLGLYDDVL